MNDDLSIYSFENSSLSFSGHCIKPSSFLTCRHLAVRCMVEPRTPGRQHQSDTSFVFLSSSVFQLGLDVKFWRAEISLTCPRGSSYVRVCTSYFDNFVRCTEYRQSLDCSASVLCVRRLSESSQAGEIMAATFNTFINSFSNTLWVQFCTRVHCVLAITRDNKSKKIVSLYQSTFYATSVSLRLFSAISVGRFVICAWRNSRVTSALCNSTKSRKSPIFLRPICLFVRPSTSEMVYRN